MALHINMSDYGYPLPEDRIAKYPLAERDSSKLLTYRDGNIGTSCFKNLPEMLPEGALMVFNDTKVVPARLFFTRQTGAHIEVFCLEPYEPKEYVTAFSAKESCVWKCLIGNAKRWRNDIITLYNPGGSEEITAMSLRARLMERKGETGLVEFSWNGGLPFSAVLDACGKVPIPPYLNRDTEDIDLERYQTLYARIRGSVAAPTAGLHFTQKVLEGISARGIGRENVCLHVGAGTFLPVKGGDVAAHSMHREPFVVSLSLLRKLARRDRPLVAVGTTSVRTLESLYYAGVDCIEHGHPEDILQWAPYEREYDYPTDAALKALISYLEDNGLKELKLGTKLIIVPGFRFRLVDLLVTNFHQSESTLLLLVSAFVGGDWRRIYDYALENAYRFLSYGDSSLLWRNRSNGLPPDYVEK